MTYLLHFKYLNLLQVDLEVFKQNIFFNKTWNNKFDETYFHFIQVDLSNINVYCIENLDHMLTHAVDKNITQAIKSIGKHFDQNHNAGVETVTRTNLPK